MSKKRFSISTRFSIFVVCVILVVVTLSSIITGVLFSKNCLESFYESARTELSEFSDSISMFFSSKEVELNVFAECDAVKNADETIHSFVNETGPIQIMGYKKSPTEEAIRKICKLFARNDRDIAEIYIGTKWGGYATNFDSSMNGGYDPRKRGWYDTANKGNGKVMITDAFASTVGATVVGITRCVYTDEKEFVGNASIEVSLDTLSLILGGLNLGEGSFFMMVQNDGTILADTSENKNNFKKVDEIGIPGLPALLASGNKSGRVDVDGTPYFAEYVVNKKTGYKILALCPSETVFVAFYSTLKITVIICLIFAFIVSLITALITRKVIYPLKVIGVNISGNASEISKGKADLTKRLSIRSNNEIGDVADSFNIFYEKLQDIIKNMKQTKVSLNEAGERLNDSTRETMTAITQISGSIVSVDKNLTSQNEEVTDTVNNVNKILSGINSLEKLVSAQVDSVRSASRAVNQMIENISEVDASIEQMASSFGVLETEAANGAKTQAELQKQIGEIQNQSKLLSEANAVIASIAEETNLLAMNAAIEAAHAGESGKGFAVVAGEIRKLSETSSTQSKTIGEQLNRIQNTIGTVVDATQKGVRGYTNLANKIHETDVLVRNIKTAMSEQQNGSSMITSALQDVNSNTEQVHSASKEMNLGSHAVMTEINRLQKETDSMRQGMDEMSANAKKINSLGASLSEISSLMEDSIKKMGKQVDQFVV